MPGPGTYKTPTCIGEGKKSSMCSRTSANSIWLKNENPGPGSYDPKDKLQDSQKVTIKGRYNFGTSIVVNSDGTHDKIISQPDGKVPGPGTYSAKHDLVEQSLSTKIGSCPRPSLIDREASKVPAPNAYSRDAKTPVMRRAPSFGFGATFRPQTDNKKTPGPGSYHTERKISEGI